MGALMTYRKSPLLDFEFQKGESANYKFAACRITGWRKSQEDRLVIVPEYSHGFSLFAVYDGHGGAEIAEYLSRHFHNHLEPFINEHEPEMALKLAFLSFDNAIRNVDEEEKEELMNYNDDSSDVPNRNEFMSALTSLVSGGTPGPSNESEGNSDEDSAVKNYSETFKFLVHDKLDSEDDEDDSDDKSYDEDEDMGHSDNSEVEEQDSNEENITGQSTSTADPPESSSSKLDDAEPKMSDDKSNSEKSDGKEEKDMSHTEDEENKESDSDHENAEPLEDPEPSSADAVEPEFGDCSGSTATVVLLNNEKVFVANVGDSRCVASVNGRAMDLTVDHRPSDKEELARIKAAGSVVTEDDRIDGGLNMSRAFGNFEKKRSDDVSEPIISDPHIMAVDIAHTEFIVVASDGIWNSMNSQEVIDYINIRKESAQLDDICEELFKFIVAEDSRGDGSGLDNMSLIIVVPNFQTPSSKENHAEDEENEDDICLIEEIIKKPKCHCACNLPNPIETLSASIFEDVKNASSDIYSKIDDMSYVAIRHFVDIVRRDVYFNTFACPKSCCNHVCKCEILICWQKCFLEYLFCIILCEEQVKKDSENSSISIPPTVSECHEQDRNDEGEVSKEGEEMVALPGCKRKRSPSSDQRKKICINHSLENRIKNFQQHMIKIDGSIPNLNDIIYRFINALKDDIFSLERPASVTINHSLSHNPLCPYQPQHPIQFQLSFVDDFITMEKVRYIKKIYKFEDVPNSSAAEASRNVVPNCSSTSPVASIDEGTSGNILVQNINVPLTPQNINSDFTDNSNQELVCSPIPLLEASASKEKSEDKTYENNEAFPKEMEQI